MDKQKTMKEGGGSGGDEGGVSVTTGKRRWRNLVIGVLFLVILSMVVPLAFLFGLHNGFHSPNLNFNGYVLLRETSVPGDLKSYDKYENSDDTSYNSENDRSTHINELVQKSAPNISKPEQMATLAAKVDELGEETWKLTEEIGSYKEEITRERVIDQLTRMDNLVSEGELTLNEFEDLVNLEGEAYNREHNLRLNVLRPAFNRLHSEIATWREVKFKHGDEFMKAVNLWTWYYPKRDDGGNAELKLIVHHETSRREKDKMEDTLEEMRKAGSIAAAGVKTSWEEGPKIRTDDIVRNFYA